jgi:anhydro-N-acetylmuramic acid kinase
MSGTSADGVDASIIQSDGDTEYKVILDKYFKYGQNIYENIHNLKEKINDSKDLENLSKKVESLEKEITLFHANAVNEIIEESKSNIDFVGFHGQTIFHNAKEKISKQLGDGKLLSKLTQKTVIYDFRKNDIKNGGHGAPLTPIFHKLLKTKFKIKEVTFVNIGGIVNTTTLQNDNMSGGTDIGPGMCLIDRWVRQESKKNYDANGIIAKSGKVNKIALHQLLENFYEKENILSTEPIQSFDTKYFDFSFVKDLSLEDGAATLTEFTVRIIISALKATERNKEKVILCGGGRKNNFLVERLKEENRVIKLIDDYGIDGDFVESQAFAYLAIRSYLKIPISFPMTTGCSEPCTGGVIIKN